MQSDLDALDDSDSSEDLSRSAHADPSRRFVRDGVLWTVRECAPPIYDRRSRATLIFESADVVRRVRDFPPDWMTCSDGELYELSLRR